MMLTHIRLHSKWFSSYLPNLLSSMIYYLFLLCYYLCKSRWKLSILCLVFSLWHWLLGFVVRNILLIYCCHRIPWWKQSLWFWSATLTPSVYRDLTREYYGPIDQKYQREAPSAIRWLNRPGVEFWGSTSLPNRPAHVRPIHKATHGLQWNFEHPHTSCLKERLKNN